MFVRRPPGYPLVAQMAKNPPAMQEMGIRSLGGEDPLEEGMATPSSVLAWRTPGTEEAGGPQSVGLQESDATERLSTHNCLCHPYAMQLPLEFHLLCSRGSSRFQLQRHSVKGQSSASPPALTAAACPWRSARLMSPRPPRGSCRGSL